MEVTIYYEDPDDDPRIEDAPRMSSGGLDFAEIYKQVDAALDASRPERYFAKETTWMQPVIDLVKEQLGSEDIGRLVTDTAKRIVCRREGIAKTRTARVFRGVGQLPLGYGTPECLAFLRDATHVPVQISDSDVVRLGALTNEDLVELELHHQNREKERREAADIERDGIIAVRDFLASRPTVRRLDDLF